MKNNIIANNGSVQHIESIPIEIREKYKTVWELPMKHLIDMSADRGAFICQSQSLNLWLEDPNYNTLTSMHFYSWSKGLKTGIYYLRRKAAHQPQQFTIEPDSINKDNIIELEHVYTFLKIIKSNIINGKHVSAIIKPNVGSSIKLICFDCINTHIGEYLLSYKKNINVIGQIHENIWNNKKTIQLNIKDLIL